MKSLKERLEEKIESNAWRYDTRVGGSCHMPSYKAGAESLVPLVVELAKKLEFYADGEGDVLDWDRVNDKSCIQDRGKTAHEALQSIEKFIEDK